MSEVKKLSEIARTVLGTIYILGAAVNLRLAFLGPNVYQEYIRNLPNSLSLIFIRYCGAQS